MKTGVELIAAERVRQVEQEGWTNEHDEIHSVGELRAAAVCYLFAAGRLLSEPGVPTEKIKSEIIFRRLAPNWPWGAEWLKISDDPIRNYVKAGALIAAEIDRIQRAEFQPLETHE